MKNIIAITAFFLTVGIIGIHAVSAAPGWHRGYMHDNVYHGNDFGPGYMQSAVSVENKRSTSNPGYCFADEVGHQGFRQHMTDYGYGPMHRNGYRR